MKKLWSPELKRVYSRYPALIRSRNGWDAAVNLVKKGDVEGALEIGAAHEKRSAQIQAQNVMARRIRIERMKLFALQTQTIKRLREIFRKRSDAVSLAVLRRADQGLRALPDLKKKVSGELAALRTDLKVEITNSIWNAVLLGVKNMEDALVPIFKANRESFAQEINLMEERLSIGLDSKLAGSGNPKLKRGSSNWDKATDKIYKKIITRGFEGQTPSARIWDLTKRTELEMHRALSRELATGGSPRDIAKRLEKFLAPEVLDRETDVELGSGVYRSAFKNAMRLARTEAGRAYTEASAAWAQSREWVKGLMVTLSPAHDGGTDGDDCDDVAGDVYSPEEFSKVVPVHPHCMCFPTVVIDEKYLDPDRRLEDSEL